jgi:RimJ/RimL family protein N-acetyltransferase
MLREERLLKIADFRQRKLRGAVMDMVPMQPDDTREVLRLRNAERAIWALAQGVPLTEEMHRRWYREYLARNDDIAWMMRRPDGVAVGTMALYSIDPDGRQAEQGRLVIDEASAMSAPYAIQAELLLLDLAFRGLDMLRIITTIRPENGKVISMYRRMGFRFVRDVELRATAYYEYALDRAEFAPQPLERIVNHWRSRLERATS